MPCALRAEKRVNLCACLHPTKDLRRDLREVSRKCETVETGGDFHAAVERDFDPPPSELEKVVTKTDGLFLGLAKTHATLELDTHEFAFCAGSGVFCLVCHLGRFSLRLVPLLLGSKTEPTLPTINSVKPLPPEFPLSTLSSTVFLLGPAFLIAWFLTFVILPVDVVVPTI